MHQKACVVLSGARLLNQKPVPTLNNAHSAQKTGYSSTATLERPNASIPLLNQPIFTMEPHTWAREPVYGQLWREFKEGRAECAEEDFLDTPFSEDELELSMAVCNAFGKYSGPELSKLIHKEAS